MNKKYTETEKRDSLDCQKNKSCIQLWLTPEQKEKYQRYADSQELMLSELVVKALDKYVDRVDAKTQDGSKVYYDKDYNIYILKSDGDKNYLENNVTVIVYDDYRFDYFNMSVLELKEQLMIQDKFVKEPHECNR